MKIHYDALPLTFFLLFSSVMASPTIQHQKQEDVAIQTILASDVSLMESTIDDVQEGMDDNFYCYECYGLMGYTSSGQLIEPVDQKCFQTRTATGYPTPVIPDEEEAEKEEEGAMRISRGKATTGNLTTYCVTMRGRYLLNFDSTLIINPACDLGFCVDFIARGRITINETEVTGSNSTLPNLLNGKCWMNQLNVFDALKPFLTRRIDVWNSLEVNNKTWRAQGGTSAEIETCYCNYASGCNDQPMSQGYDRFYYKWVDESSDNSGGDEKPGNGGEIIHRQSQLLVVILLGILYTINLFL